MTCAAPEFGLSKGRFTRYDFVAYDKLTTGLRHELFRVNQTYNSLNGPKSSRRPVVSLSYATKSYRWIVLFVIMCWRLLGVISQLVESSRLSLTFTANGKRQK